MMKNWDIYTYLKAYVWGPSRVKGLNGYEYGVSLFYVDYVSLIYIVGGERGRRPPLPEIVRSSY